MVDAMISKMKYYYHPHSVFDHIDPEGSNTLKDLTTDFVVEVDNGAIIIESATRSVNVKITGLSNEPTSLMSYAVSKFHSGYLAVIIVQDRGAACYIVDLRCRVADGTFQGKWVSFDVWYTDRELQHPKIAIYAYHLTIDFPKETEIHNCFRRYVVSQYRTVFSQCYWDQLDETWTCYPIDDSQPIIKSARKICD